MKIFSGEREPTVGALYKSSFDRGPFDRVLHVEVTAVQDGWVQYKFTDGDKRWSWPVKQFNQLYAPESA